MSLGMPGMAEGSESPMSPQKMRRRWSGARVVWMWAEEVGVDGAEAALVDVGLGAAEAELEGFVGADVEEGAGEVVRRFG